jgi:SSS family solute:Na+ symporter
MSTLDWLVLAGTLVAIVGYGMWRARGGGTTADYLHGGYRDDWATIGLSVMATQASAITFLSTPGQAYQDGMRFVQFYFGLPLAMVALSVAFVPRFYRLKVFTAYEYLETRFDLKTRQLTALLFLLQRGLSAGITIYAPAIILSKVLGWSLNLTNVAIGGLVIAYTVAGGTRAVTQTQKQQMVVMLGGMVVAFFVIVHRLGELPGGPSFPDAVRIAGTLGKLNIIDASFDPGNRYTLWTGLTGGFFLAMSYFGTDQSQVQRYLSGRSVTESRLGLLFNGLLKVPMQALILFVGVMVFVFHQFTPTPVFFNESELRRVYDTPHAGEMRRLEGAHGDASATIRRALARLHAARELPSPDAAAVTAAEGALKAAVAADGRIRDEARALIGRALPRGETKDADYVFLSFVMANLPRGLIGLLLAVIFCAAMSSTASELSALGQCTLVDFYQRSWRREATDAHYLRAAKLFTAGWGVLAVVFAASAALLDNLIQAVNILGSLFYGTILGVFLVGFFARKVRGTAMFAAAIVSELVVFLVWLTTSIGFLWFNVIGCAAAVALAFGFDALKSRRPA